MHKFVKDIGLIGLTNLSLFLRAIVILPVITKLLGAQSYGVWVQFLITLSLITSFALLGLPASLVRFLASVEDKKVKAQKVCSILTVVIASALCVGGILLFFRSQLAMVLGISITYIALLAVTTIFECINSLLFNVFRAFHQMENYAFFSTAQSFGEIFLACSAILLGYGLLGAVASLLIARVIMSLLLITNLLRKIGFSMPSYKEFGAYLAFGIPTIGSNIAYWVVTSSDRYVINYFLGITFVGYYSPAYTFGNLLVIFIMPFSLVLPPLLSRFFDSNDHQSVQRYLAYSLKYFLLIAIPAAFGLSVLSWPLLATFTTSDIANHSYLITPFIAASMICYGIFTIISQVFDLIKKTSYSTFIWTYAALVNLSLNFFFVPHFGIMGAALSTLFVYVLALFITVFFALQRFRFSLDARSISKSILASSIMALVLYVFAPTGLSGIIGAIVIGVGMYGALIIFLRVIDEKEKKFFREMFQNFRHAFIQP